MTKYSSTKTREYVGYSPNFLNQFQGFKSHNEMNERRAGRFAFVTEEVINLRIDEAVPENTKNSLHMLLTFLTVRCFLSFQPICNLTQACCETFAWFHPSFTFFNSP